MTVIDVQTWLAASGVSSFEHIAVTLVWYKPSWLAASEVSSFEHIAVTLVWSIYVELPSSSKM